MNVGSSTTYTITVTNNGPDIEPAGIIISDTIPAGTNASETEADCTITAGVFRCTTVTPLAVGASRSYQLTLALPAAYAAATLVNTATITTFPIPDPVAANNASTDTDTVPQANLSITKTDSVDPVNPGQSFNYTLTVNNAGPSTATGLTVSDTVPSQYTVTTVTSPIGSCGNVGNVVTCTLAVDGVGRAGVGDHRERDGQDHDPGRHVRQHGHGERGVAERSRAREQHREQQQHGDGVRRPGADQDRRHGDGDRRHVDDVHDHDHEQRAVDRARGCAVHRYDPRRHGGVGGRGRLRDRGRRLHLHHG